MGILHTTATSTVCISAKESREHAIRIKPVNRPIVRIYLFSVAKLENLITLIRSCLNGVWLGILKVETLHEIDAHYYTLNRIYFSDKYNKSGLQSWERNVTCEYFQACKKILIAGAGGGREVLALQKLSYSVDGFECHPELQEYANELLEKEGLIPSVRLTPRDQSIQSGQVYDGVIVGWGAYMLIQGRKKRVAFLKQLRSQTEDQAPILLSFFTRSYDSLYFRLIRQVANALRWVLMREGVEIGDDLSPNYVHYFTEGEIGSELREAGFEIKLYSDKQYGHAVGIAC